MIRIVFRYLRFCVYDIKYKLLSKRRGRFVIRDTLQTIQYILKNKCGVSRYGDGEFNIIFGKGNGFQKYDAVLSRRLLEILTSNMEGHIVCIPFALTSIRNFNLRARYALVPYICSILKKLEKILDVHKTYYDAGMTRFYIDYKDKQKSKEIISLLKKIWENQNICIIEGEYSRLGAGNDLFSGAKNITRILCPSKNAFDKYEEILRQSEKIPAGTLVLIALGMTATVLAYDLTKLGYQAVDIGHIDIEYEWMRNGARVKTALPNKYVNEVQDGAVNTALDDQIYLAQITAHIV
ncbi:MAG: SP_1767 family glycosyltransferase [Spirochaetaceae bacterium]|nr:SP_1767 family glycosyltransferase [Spirochaetaceae bacterium]